MNKGDFELFNASGESIQIESIRTFLLKLPLDKVLELIDCYNMLKIIRNIISIPLLLEHSFEINIKDNGCFIYYFDDFYGNRYMDNNIMFLSFNDNILHIKKMKKRMLCKTPAT